MNRAILFGLAGGLSLALAAATLRAEEPKKEAAADASSAKPQSITPQEKDRNRHEQFLARIKEGPVGLLFLGDSITDAWRAPQQKEIWEKYYGAYHPANFGISGDQTQHVLWRLEHGELEGIDPKVTVMMIGTNNFGNNKVRPKPDEVALGVETLVKTIHEKLPNTKILLLGIFPRGMKADDPFRAMIKDANERLAKLDNGKTVRYLDIGGKFLEPDGTLPKEIMPDALHPNTKGYGVWAEAMQPLLKEMMGSSEK